MLASVRTISQLISDEVDAGIPSERIVVGGFSQGKPPGNTAPCSTPYTPSTTGLSC